MFFQGIWNCPNGERNGYIFHIPLKAPAEYPISLCETCHSMRMFAPCCQIAKLLHCFSWRGFGILELRSAFCCTLINKWNFLFTISCGVLADLSSKSTGKWSRVSPTFGVVFRCSILQMKFRLNLQRILDLILIPFGCCRPRK